MAAIFEPSRKDLTDGGLKDALRKNDPNWSVLRAKARVAPPGDAAIERWHDLLFKTARLCGLNTSKWQAKKPSRAALDSAAAQLGRVRGAKRSRSPSPGPANKKPRSPSPGPAPSPRAPPRSPSPDILASFAMTTESPDSALWTLAVAELKKTMSSSTITRVLKVSGPVDALYDAKRRHLGPGCTERLLWHGSRTVTQPPADPIYTCIARDGFKPLLSGTKTGAIWGDGTYFARDASYSHDYALRVTGSAAPTRRLLLCEVLTGEHCQGARGMKLLPTKPSGGTYDSLVDDPTNPSIFVIQDGWQARVKLIVDYIP